MVALKQDVTEPLDPWTSAEARAYARTWTPNPPPAHPRIPNGAAEAARREAELDGEFVPYVVWVRRRELNNLDTVAGWLMGRDGDADERMQTTLRYAIDFAFGQFHIFQPHAIWYRDLFEAAQ